MGILDFAESVKDFHRKSDVDRLLLLAWFLESVENKKSFDSASLRGSFQKVGCDPPNVGQYLTRLAARNPPPIVKIGRSYRLSGTVRREFDQKYLEEPSVAVVSKLLTDLPNLIPNLTERGFLHEAINCYKVKAYRAAIVMVWNLAYDHLRSWILADQDRMDKFNASVPKRFPQKKTQISCVDDFDEFKESEVIAVCRTARLLSKNTVDILDAKLTRRNIAAHPSTVTISQAQADDSITDLVNNVVLVLR